MDPAPGDAPDPLRRFDRDLTAFESSRQKSVSSGWGGATDGYRVLGQILGGVFGGVGVGWLIDHFLHTPHHLGIVGGLMIGSGLSIFSAIRTASRVSAKVVATNGPAPSVPDDDED